jgi:S-ribosylhomocysteine lyase
MDKIASFTINHDTLEKGMYISRVDWDIVTYDLRLKKPNQGDYFPMGAAHTMEHLFATFIRNSEIGKYVIYFGPMGCRTGFYLLLREEVTHRAAIEAVKAAFGFIAGYTSEIPGTQKAECGNYLDHDLAGARDLAADMVKVLENWTEDDLRYKI